VARWTSDFALPTDSGSASETNNMLAMGRGGNGLFSLGIGTATPSYPLEVIGPEGGTAARFSDNINGTIEIRFPTMGEANIFANNAQMSFSTVSGEIMRFDADNNVGIGTNDPISSLHIRKDAGYALGPVLTLENGSGGGGSGGALDFYTSAVGGTEAENVQARIQSYDTGSYGGHLLFLTKESGSINGALTERMRITSDGNVGIGTDSPLAGLHLENNGSTASYNNGNSRALLGTDFANNPVLELQTGKTGFSQGYAAAIDFSVSDDVDFDTRLMQGDGTNNINDWFYVMGSSAINFSTAGMAMIIPIFL